MIHQFVRITDWCAWLQLVYVVAQSDYEALREFLSGGQRGGREFLREFKDYGVRAFPQREKDLEKHVKDASTVMQQWRSFMTTHPDFKELQLQMKNLDGLMSPGVRFPDLK